MILQARALTHGHASALTLKLDEPLSLWGGVNLLSGEIVDRTHPQCGIGIAGTALAMRMARGSSSSSSALVELVRVGMAPQAIILTRHDPILVIGALVAAELYGIGIPILVASLEDWLALPSGLRLTIDATDDHTTLTIE